MSFSPLIEQLIHALRCLPGVGPKTAQRMAFHLLQRDRENARHLCKVLIESIDTVRQCEHCQNLSEQPICKLCSNERRDNTLLCIVENPIDVIAIEQTQAYRGYYFVLMGHLSPLDGIGPQDLGIPLLLQRIQSMPFTEIILATNPTPEGEATAHYISELTKNKNIRLSRIAYGVPLGSELEYIDGGTLTRAINRREVALSEEI